MRSFELIGNEIGFFILIGLLILASIVIIQSPLPKPLRVLIVIALALRVIGAAARFTVLTTFYQGVGDAMGYYMRGLLFAEFFQNLDWAPITDPQYWWARRWWGTTPMFWISAAVLSVIGPTMLGEFIVFSVFSFLGLACFVVAFHRSFPVVPIHRYARWAWLFPSLWFWPSSVGKEAVVLLGLGLAVLGFIGRKDQIHWLPLVLGVSIVFIIRPQFAALFLLVASIAYWLGRGRRWTPGKTFQSLLIAVTSVAIVWIGLRTTGMESFDLEGAEEYVGSETGRYVRGGSAIEAPSIGLSGAPIAVINVLFRPFPWESSNAMMLASSVELVVLWFLVLRRRRHLVRSLRGWRSSRLLRLAVAFVFVYTLGVGMTVANLGLIARQRIFLFPFLFIFLEAVVLPVRVLRRPAGAAMPVAYPPPAVRPQGAPWPQPTPGTPGRSSSR